MILASGQALKTESGKICRVDDFIGAGGQGEVFRADIDGYKVALKWYFPTQATERQKATLEYLIRIGSPTNKFLWPIEIVSLKDKPGYGYIMRLRESRFKGVSDLLKRRIEPSFRALCTAAYELADNFLELHAKGLCYQDISDTNIFLDPASGEICISDNDNVTIDGQEGGILGTPRFMAPEVVVNRALPSADTDRFSLAALLFYMFFLNHPLEGERELKIRCLDLPAMYKLYGEEPIFIYDPDNNSNRPVKGEHDNAIIYWTIYPNFFRQLFIKSFTIGLTNPKDGRVRESEWRREMIHLRDSIMYCGNCGVENFYDPERLREGSSHECWHCKAEILLPPRLRIKDNVIVLNHNTSLSWHHLGKDWDFSEKIGEVVRHPKDPKVWGLRNKSADSWVCTLPDGTSVVLPPGKTVPIATGVKINFGAVEGEVRT